MRISDWSSDVCSSDLNRRAVGNHVVHNKGVADRGGNVGTLHAAASTQHPGALTECMDADRHQLGRLKRLDRRLLLRFIVSYNQAQEPVGIEAITPKVYSGAPHPV